MKILVTGASGYLGSVAVATLRGRGHEVVTIGRHAGVDMAVCDLRDAQSVRSAVHGAGECEAVIHFAGRAHDFRGLSLDDLIAANTITTRNLIAALRDERRTERVRFVQASSVAVYELLTPSRINARDAPYAASKLLAEQLLHEEPFASLHVLRFAPIHDPGHLRDIAKRVFLPGTGLKLRLVPPPMHALCPLDLAVETIVDAVEHIATSSHHLANIATPLPTSQTDLLHWFSGWSLPVPTAPLLLTAGVLARCGGPGRQVARAIRKFADSGLYPEPDWKSTLAWSGPRIPPAVI